MVDGGEWRDECLEVYRVMLGEVLTRWSRLTDVEGEYLCDELRESLLDLKQAVIEDDRSWGFRAADEVLLLNQELRSKYPEML